MSTTRPEDDFLTVGDPLPTEQLPRLELRAITREEFVGEMKVSSGREDAFARTFVSKCDMLKAWPQTFGIVVDGRVAAAITVTLSKRKPLVGNLQLLHTFAWARKRGYARHLCMVAVGEFSSRGAEYFRVSSEPESVDFYRKCGFKFWGRQKKCFLSMFQVAGTAPCDGVYCREDPVIQKALHSGRKGSLVETFEEPR